MDVSDNFEDLISITSDEFPNLLITYQKYTCVFPSKRCVGIPDNEIIRTANAAESYHRYLVTQFYVTYYCNFIIIKCLCYKN